MAEIILFIASSLDGFIASPDGSIDWLFTDQDYGYSEFYAGVETVIMGNKTYQQVLGFDEYPYPDKQVFVLTRDRTKTKDKNAIFISQEIPEFITNLRSLAKGNIWLVGGGEVIEIFLQQGLIDRLILSIHPLLLGKGIPLFLPDFPSQNLELKDTQTFASGLVQLNYQVVRGYL